MMALKNAFAETTIDPTIETRKRTPDVQVYQVCVDTDSATVCNKTVCEKGKCESTTFTTNSYA